MDTAFQLEQEPKSRSPSLWKRMRNILLLSSFLGLLSFNIATLINDTLHTSAFNVLSSVLGNALGNLMLSHSPTVMRRQEVEKLTKEKKELIKDNTTLQEKHTKLKTESKEVAVKTKELADKNKALEKDKEILTKNNTALQEKNTRLKTESAKRSDALQKTSKRMADRSTVGATRNIASLPGEAIPLLGTALIIGVTTWDIYDFCNNLKDLNELNTVFEHQLEDQDKVCGMKVPTKEKVMDEVEKNWQKAYRTAAYHINQSGWTVPEIPPIMTWDEIIESVRRFFLN